MSAPNSRSGGQTRRRLPLHTKLGTAVLGIAALLSTSCSVDVGAIGGPGDALPEPLEPAEQLLDRVFTDDTSPEALLSSLPEPAATVMGDAMDKLLELPSKPVYPSDDTWRVRLVKSDRDSTVLIASASAETCVLAQQGEGVTSACGSTAATASNGLFLAIQPPGEELTRIYGVAPLGANAIGSDNPTVTTSDGVFVHKVTPESVEALYYFADDDRLDPL